MIALTGNCLQITFTVDGGNLVEEHVGEIYDLITYKLDGNHLVTVSGVSLLRPVIAVHFQTTQTGDIVCRRWFKRQ